MGYIPIHHEMGYSYMYIYMHAARRRERKKPHTTMWWPAKHTHQSSHIHVYTPIHNILFHHSNQTSPHRLLKDSTQWWCFFDRVCVCVCVCVCVEREMTSSAAVYNISEGDWTVRSAASELAHTAP